MIKPLSLTRRGLCLGLACAFLLPPNAAWARSGPQGDAAPAEPVLDLRPLDALDVDPTNGALLFSREDLRVGDAAEQLVLRRTYHPWAGDRLNMGLHWVSLLDIHLDVDAELTRASFVTPDGARIAFAADAEGVLRATTGRPAVVEVYADGFVLRGLGDDRTYRFDRAGWPTSVRSGALTIDYRFDAERRLEALAGPWGEVVCERDDDGVLTALVAPGQTVRYVRGDEDGRLTRVERHGLFETYGYDGSGRLAALADGQGEVAYDALGRVTAIRGEGLRPTTVDYLRTGDPEAALRAEVTRAGQPSTVTVSRDGRRIAYGVPGAADPDVATVVRLDERDRPVEVALPDGRAWTLAYDEAGRLESREGPTGRTTFAYGSSVTARPTRIALADGQELAFTYDLRGNVLTASAGAATTTYGYDERGRLTSVTDPRGRETTYAYDERGYVVEVVEDGEATRLRRDDAGRVDAVKAASGRLVEVVRDAAGRVTELRDALGSVLEADYDARGNLVRYRDELGTEVRYRWNARGELTAAYDAVGTLLECEYDDDGRLAAMVDAGGNRTTYARPDARTLIVDDPTAGRRVLRSDELGRLVEEVRGGATIGYRYDEHGRLAVRTTPEGEESFVRDERGRLIAITGPDGGYALGYDERGRLETLEDTALGMEVRYGYDPVTGDRTELTLPWGTVGYGYDDRGFVDSVTLPDGRELTMELGRGGRREAIHYPNGVTTRLDYARGRLTEVVTERGDELIDRRAYGYDARGRIAWTEDAGGARTDYEHDARGRLVAAVTGDDEAVFEYDAADNRVAEERAGERVEVEVGAGNRVVQKGETTFAYGPSGELTEVRGPDGTTVLGYDVDGHLDRVERPDGEVVRYGHAPNGQRLWREGAEGRVHYLSDLADVVGEVDASGELITAYVHGPGNDDVLAAVRGDDAFFYHYDLVRSVTAITDGEGAPAARYAYGAFGEERLAEGEAAEWNPFRYTSRELDPTSGLYHYRARTYSPELGRFTSPDPLGRLGGVNTYAYVDNDPTRFNDPYGLKKWYERLWDGVRDTASTVATHAVAFGETIVEDVRSGQMGRNLLAFGKGFGKGLWGAATGIYNMVRHPVDTVNGIIYAVENWDETKEALLAKWEEYKDAAVNDPERFAEMTGYLTAEVLTSVVGAKGLDKLAKARSLATLGRAASGAARAAGSPLTRLTGRVGTSLARRFPRVAGALRRSRVLSRARSIEAARRAAAGGNVLRRAGRRVANVGRDLGRAGRLMVREPGAFLAHSGRGLGRAGAGLVASTGRGMWSATRRFGIPAALIFDDQITDAINRTANRAEATARVNRVARPFLEDADLPPDRLAARITEVGRAYDDYRDRLLAPVHEEDRRLEARLNELNAAVERGEIPDEAIDSRLDALLEEYGRRRLDLMVDIYERHADVEHDMFDPSPNRLVSYEDEIALLRAALERRDDPAGRALLEARIDDLEARAAYERDLHMAGDHDTLIAGIAGPTRAPGEEGSSELHSALDGVVDPAEYGE